MASKAEKSAGAKMWEVMRGSLLFSFLISLSLSPTLSPNPPLPSHLLPGVPPSLLNAPTLLLSFGSFAVVLFDWSKPQNPPHQLLSLFEPKEEGRNGCWSSLFDLIKYLNRYRTDSGVMFQYLSSCQIIFIGYDNNIFERWLFVD